MNIKQIKQKIAETDWYYQGGAGKMLYLSYPWVSVYEFQLFQKPIAPHFETFVVTRGIDCAFWHTQKSLTKIAKFYYFKHLRNPKFIDSLQKFWLNKVVPIFLNENQFILENNFSSLSNRKFLELIDKFSIAYINLFQEVIFLDSFDFYGDVVLQNALKNEKVNFLSKEMELLTCPPEASNLQKERLELLSLAENILKRKLTTRHIIKTRSLSNVKLSWIKNRLDRISKQYYWLHNDYASVDYLDANHFYQKLRDLILHRLKLKEELAMRSHIKNVSLEKNKIIAKYGLSSNFVRDTNFLSYLGNLRDLRKSYNQMAGNAIEKIGQEVARRSGLAFNEVENLFFYELGSAFKPNKALRKKIKVREKQAVYWIVGAMKNLEFYGRDAYILDEFSKNKVFKRADLKGRPAYRGIVKGSIKIIKNKSDFKKMKRGDILVAPNTRPEYVPIMKIAGAIVTDEGGITSHAAIVSRELKVPCVVGVQGVTTILKDGQLVEVDANQGVVRVIKQ